MHKLTWLGAAILAITIGGVRAEAVVLEWSAAEGGNGHYYELVEESLNWLDARNAAAARTYLGFSGHLVSITSAAENQFLIDNFSLNHQWIGAFQFDKLAEPAGHWHWVTDEAFVYTNWNQVSPHFEPNESGVEDWAAFGTNIFAPDGTDLEGKWQDWKVFGDAPSQAPIDRVNGYFVEYESAVIPEPLSVVLFSFGLVGFASARRESHS